MSPDGPDRPRVPGRLASWLVLTTVRTLPRRAPRRRFQQELLGELYGLGRTRQVREAASLLVHCLALRGAVAPMTDEESTMTPTRPAHKPLLCYLHHKLRTVTTPDGTTYRTCVRCGEDHYDGVGDNNITGNVITAVINGAPGR